MNLMINNYCNFKCSYCFAQEEMHSKKAMNITMDNFCEYLNFLQKNNSRQVRLIGGEPTLHPELSKLIDKVIEYNFFDEVLIFTNLSFSHDIAEMLIEKNKIIPINLLANINDLDLLLPNARERVLDNLDFLSTSLSTFERISINIFSPDQDLKKWENIVCKYNIKTIRWSIVVPNQDLEKDFDVCHYFHQFQPLMLDFIQWTKKYGIELTCDCSVFPLCALDDWAISKILRIDPFFFNRRTCEEPVLDITPDLNVRGCFGCRGMSQKNLKTFNTFDEIYDFFEKDRKKISSNLARKECLHCDRYITIGQSCTCLGYRNLTMEDIKNENQTKISSF